MKVKITFHGYLPVIEADIEAVDPLSLWYWIPPDQILDAGYQDTEFKTRNCTLTADENSCPGVVIFGEADNHKNSRTYDLTKQLQYFAADLISLSVFGVHFTELDVNSAERESVNHAFTWIYKNEIVFCNGDSGFGAATPKTNCLTGEYGQEFPKVDAYRWLVTNSIRPARYLDNPIIENSHGEKVIAADSFVLDELPLVVVESDIFEKFMAEYHPILEGNISPDCLKQVVNTVFLKSCDSDLVTFNYGAEILDDPRVGFITQQELHGNVTGFDFFTNIDPTPFPFITRPEQPAFYPLKYLQGFADKKPLYYTV